MSESQLPVWRAEYDQEQQCFLIKNTMTGEYQTHFQMGWCPTDDTMVPTRYYRSIWHLTEKSWLRRVRREVEWLNKRESNKACQDRTASERKRHFEQEVNPR